MAKINELNEGLELELKDTFGDLTFLRMKTPTRVQDEETEQWVDTDYRYVVQSSKQLSEEIISIPASEPLKEFEFGDKVELKNPKIELFAFNQGQNRRTRNRIKITAEGIEKANKKTDSTSNKQGQAAGNPAPTTKASEGNKQN